MGLRIANYLAEAIVTKFSESSAFAAPKSTTVAFAAIFQIIDIEQLGNSDCR